MHYVIYPDTLFVENFICNLLFLTFMKSLFFPAAKGKRIFLAASITAICNTLVSILLFHNIWIFQLGGLFPAAGLMVCACLEIKEPRRVLFLLYQMILWTFVLGGILQVLEQWTRQDTGTVILSTGLLLVVFGILEKTFRIYKRQNDCMREVVLYWKGRSCHIKGFADTGNHLIEPLSKKPVSIITFEIWHKFFQEEDMHLYRWIPYTTVGKPDGVLQGIQIDYMVIDRGKDSQIIEQPMIAVTKQPFTGIFHYSILLHSDYF